MQFLIEINRNRDPRQKFASLSTSQQYSLIVHLVLGVNLIKLHFSESQVLFKEGYQGRSEGGGPGVPVTPFVSLLLSKEPWRKRHDDIMFDTV